MAETIDIIGAGIGGLTTALTFAKKGVNVNLYEGSAEIRPIGAGIIIASNAMQVFKKLGIHGKVEKSGYRISAMKITDAKLNCISSVDLREYERKYGVYNLAIQRGDLQIILANEVGFERIQLSKRLSKIEKGERYQLTFEDQTTLESNILIGADGLKSVVRSQLFSENTLRKADQMCWRGVCDFDLPRKYDNEVNEAWSKGRRFGFVKVGGGKVYWFALINAKAVSERENNLAESFSDFHDDILNLIKATPVEKIILTDIIDLKPIDKWQDERVCLIGDAAHGATPNLGQGACQAIEDAYTLGRLIEEGLPVQATFAPFEKIRKKKAHAIVDISWKIGKIAHIDSRLGMWLRNGIMKIMPKMVQKRQMDMIFDLDSQFVKNTFS